MAGGQKAIILILLIGLLVSCSEQAQLQEKYESAATILAPENTSIIKPNTPNNTPVNKALLEMFESTARQRAELQAKIHPELQKMAKERPKVKTLFTAPTREDYLRLKEKLEKKGVRLDSYEVGNTIAAEVDAQQLEEIAREEELQTATAEKEYIAFVQDSLQITGTDTLHTQNKTGKGKRIAILDTGLKTSAWFENTTIISAYFIEDDATDRNGHGTHVAGIAARTAPGATILNAKVMDSKARGTSTSILAGINWALNPDGDPATNDGADIISLSLGTIGDDPPIQQALQEAINRGVIVVAAAGNCRIGCGSFYGVTFPASMQEVIAVGAVDKNLTLAPFSSSQDFGNYTKPDYVAPGVNILSAGLQGTSIDSGTSMATPFVSGQIALLGGVPQPGNKTLEYGYGIINLTQYDQKDRNSSNNQHNTSVTGNSLNITIEGNATYSATTILEYNGDNYMCSAEPDETHTFSGDARVTPHDPAGVVIQVWHPASYSLDNFQGEEKVWYGESKLITELYGSAYSSRTYLLDVYYCYTEWNCADTDGEDLFKIGHSTETCLNLYEVKEAICSGTSVTHTTWDCRDVGRSFCKQGTCREACTRDSDCPTDYKCNSGECVSAIACYNDGDCGNDGWLNNKYCSGDDVWDTWRDYTCYNDGTSSSYCDYDDDRRQRTDCSPYYCSNGKCGSQETCNRQDDDYDGDVDEGSVCSCSDWGLDSCTSNGAKRRSGDNAQECKSTSRHDSNNILCWNTIATKGDGEFCEALPNGVCNEHGDYDCDGYLLGGDNCGNDLVCIGPTGDWSESDYDGCCNRGESWDTVNKVCLQADGTDCDNANQCSGGHCLHNKCSSTPYIIGDGYCDTGETCSNSPDDCGKCNGISCTANTQCQSENCVHGTCRATDPWCGDNYCDPGETESCGDCYGNLSVISITSWPSTADQGETITVRAKIKNLGTMRDELHLEAGVIPEEWANDWEISSYGASALFSVNPCCAANEYFDTVGISLGAKEEQTVEFTLTTPTFQSVDECDQNLPKKSAWSDQHRIVVGLYEACWKDGGTGYTSHDTEYITISQKECDNDMDCGTGGNCIFDSPTESHCEYVPCENECNINNRYTCQNNVLYECKLNTATGCTVKELKQTCVAPHTCVNGQSTCKTPSTTFTIEDALPGTTVNKQVGDKVTVHGTQITHSSGLELKGCTSDKCTLTVKSGGTHSISTSTQTEHVRVVEPETLYITNKEKLLQAYGNEEDVNKLLQSVYTKASTDGIVYYLEDYLSTAHPWNYLGDYRENPLTTYITNDYSFETAKLIREKCGECTSTIILGDDFVVPHYRRHVDISTWLGLGSRNDLIYTDIPYVSRTQKHFSEFDELFMVNGERQGKDVIFIVPGDLTHEERNQLSQLEQAFKDRNLHPGVTYMNGSITCNRPSLFTSMNRKTLVVYGTEARNPALNCFPFVAGLENEDAAFIEKNPWDGKEYSVVINTDDVQVLQVFTEIIRSGEYLKLQTEAAYIFHVSSQVVSYAALGVTVAVIVAGSGVTAAPAALLIVSAVADGLADSADVVDTCKVNFDGYGYCAMSAGFAIAPFVPSKPAKSVIRKFNDADLFRFLEPVDDLIKKHFKKLRAFFGDEAFEKAMRSSESNTHMAKGAENLLTRTDGGSLANTGLGKLNSESGATVVVDFGKLENVPGVTTKTSEFPDPIVDKLSKSSVDIGNVKGAAAELRRSSELIDEGAEQLEIGKRIQINGVSNGQPFSQMDIDIIYRTNGETWAEEIKNRATLSLDDFTPKKINQLDRYSEAMKQGKVDKVTIVVDMNTQIIDEPTFIQEITNRGFNFKRVKLPR